MFQENFVLAQLLTAMKATVAISGNATDVAEREEREKQWWEKEKEKKKEKEKEEKKQERKRREKRKERKRGRRKGNKMSR